MKSQTKILVLGVGAMAISALAAPVYAQELPNNTFSRDRNVSVRQRPRPGYEALGLRTGAFMIFPSVTTDVEGNDNIYVAPSGQEKGDVILRLRPDVSIRSTWSRHQLGGFVRGALNRFADNSTENTEEYGAGVNGRLDVVRQSYLFGGVDYQKLTEQRTDPTSPYGVVRPNEYKLFRTNVGAVREVNRLRLSGRLDYNDFSYSDNVLINGAFLSGQQRSRNALNGTGRVEYAFSPAVSAFVGGRFGRTRYDVPSQGGFDRDSKESAYTVGTSFDLTRLSRGEIEGGVVSRSFDDPRFQPVKGATLSARVELFPTELTTVTLRASRSIQETTVFAASSFTSTNFAIQLDHELLRNLLLSGTLSQSWDREQGVDRKDRRLNVNASATYLLNRRVSLTGTYTRYSDNSTGAAAVPDYKQNRVLLSLALQL